MVSSIHCNYFNPFRRGNWLLGEVQHPESAIAVLLGQVKSMLLVEIPRRSIFLRRNEPAHQPFAPARASLSCQVGQQRCLNRSPDDTTAEQERIDLAALA